MAEHAVHKYRHDNELSKKTACGLDIFVDLNARPLRKRLEVSADEREATCGNCQRAKK